MRPRAMEEEPDPGYSVPLPKVREQSSRPQAQLVLFPPPVRRRHRDRLDWQSSMGRILGDVRRTFCVSSYT